MKLSYILISNIGNAMVCWVVKGATTYLYGNK